MKWAPGANSGNPGGREYPVTDIVSVAVDAGGTVYAVGNPFTVLKFPPGATLGTVAAGGNGRGSDADQLNNPGSLFLDAVGNLYIGDADNFRVQKWAPGATSGITVAGGNGAGLDNNQISPTSICVDGAGNIYIADEYNDRVMEWAPGATSGVQLLGPSDINFGPRGIWVDAAGNLYLTGDFTNGVLRFSPGSKTGVIVAAGNGFGSASNQLNGPTTIFMDAKGDMYVSDLGNDRVQEFIPHSTIDTIYAAAEAGTYTAAVTTSGGCTLYTNNIIVKPFVTPGVSVNASATEICSNAGVTLTATPANGGATPVYAWQVNGVDAGFSGPVFTPALPAGVSSIVCKMTGDADCALQPSASSTPVAITVDPA